MITSLGTPVSGFFIGGALGSVIGWFGRRFFERRRAHQDQRTVRAEAAWDPTNLDISKATDEQLGRLKGVPDEDLLRFSITLDQFAVVESNRRLKNALHNEEKAIKWLTVVLIILTFVLVVLGILALLPLSMRR